MIFSTFETKLKPQPTTYGIPRAVEINQTANRPLEISKSSNQDPVNGKEVINRTAGSTELQKPQKISLTNSRSCSNVDEQHKENKPIEESQVLDDENKQNVETNDAVSSQQYSQKALHNFLKKRSPMYTSSQRIESEMAYDGRASSKGDNDSGRLTSSSM